MTAEIHAHQILNFLKEEPLNREQLREKALAMFGENARYRTCEVKGFDIDSLLRFFVEHHKVVDKEGTWCLNYSELCDH
jgi:probable metal-binding protein